MSKKLFIEASHNKPLLSLMDLVNPLFTRLYANITSVDLDQESRRRVADLKGKRALLLTNHPTQVEMTICYGLSEFMQDRFNFMGARRAFSYGGGVIGEIMAKTGSFSIIAGTVDRPAMKAFRKALTKPAGKMALAPEGEPMSGFNSVLMPMQSGIFKMALGALQELKKTNEGEDILIQPVFTRYAFTFEPAVSYRILLKRLDKCARHNKVSYKGNISAGLAALTQFCLEKYEQETGFKNQGKNKSARWERVQQKILQQVAQELDWAGLKPGEPLLLQHRATATVLELIELGHPPKNIQVPSKSLLKRLKYLHGLVYEMISMDLETDFTSLALEDVGEWILKLEALLDGRQLLAEGGRPSIVPRRAKVMALEPLSLASLGKEFNNDGDKIRDHISELYHKAEESSRVALTNYSG